MTLRWITAGFLFLCLSVTSSFAQTSNASVGGFVQDPSQAYIPGVTVTATNTATGVAVTAITNESGAYNIPSLLPGPYKLVCRTAWFPHASFQRDPVGRQYCGALQLCSPGRGGRPDG